MDDETPRIATASAASAPAARAAFTSRSASVVRADWSNRESICGNSGLGGGSAADKRQIMQIPSGFKPYRYKSFEAGNISSIMIAIEA